MTVQIEGDELKQRAKRDKGPPENMILKLLVG